MLIQRLMCFFVSLVELDERVLLMKQFLPFINDSNEAIPSFCNDSTQKDRANNSDREIHIYDCINLIWKTIKNAYITLLFKVEGGDVTCIYALKINLVILIPHNHISMITCIINLEGDYVSVPSLVPYCIFRFDH
jgi:hypothetical protein